jgi:peptidoglycan hydrolase-like protein with peptidoglycan-binding domain
MNYSRCLLLVALVLLPSLVTAATFTRPLVVGSQGADVTPLQQILVRQGFLSFQPTGYFGPLTAKAVAIFQTAHGIETAYR